ncbi:MAG: hypothetical protein ABIB12_03090 [Patescibacteria group bacterium]
MLQNRGGGPVLSGKKKSEGGIMSDSEVNWLKCRSCCGKGKVEVFTEYGSELEYRKCSQCGEEKNVEIVALSVREVANRYFFSGAKICVGSEDLAAAFFRVIRELRIHYPKEAEERIVASQGAVV